MSNNIALPPPLVETPTVAGIESPRKLEKKSSGSLPSSTGPGASAGAKKRVCHLI